jgi:glyoxylase-like metal-dependent hydrolase (beta-lactamase superfamily II)
MEIVQINPRVWAITGAVNMGLVLTDAGCVAIDTGLDKRAGKMLVTAAAQVGKPLIAIVNTHAHADHFGGNAYLLDKHPDIQVFATVPEAPVIRRPSFEPEYLWQGAMPFGQLRNKFLMADASRVDREFTPGDRFEMGAVSFQSIPLPGHAHGQVGILVEDVLFAADAYFDVEVTDKHGIPYLVDLDKTLESASQVLQTAASTYVPGHGRVSADPAVDVHHLVNRHEEARQEVLAISSEGLSLDVLVQEMCHRYSLSPSTSGAYLLLRTSISAYVTSCLEQGIMEVSVSNGMMTFRAL